MWNASRNVLTILSVAVFAAGGCAAPNGPADPGPKPLAAGQTCQSVRTEMDRLDRKGARGIVEAHLAGRTLASEKKSMAERYLDLLGQYLGARCHVA
jgi:hypothetical protein